MTHPTRWRGRGSYTFPVLFSPYTGEPRDARDIASDPQGLLIVQPGAPLVPAAPTPPAQQDDEALEVLRELAEVDRLRRDAERYRWLRGGPDVPSYSSRWPRWEVRYWDGRYWQTMFAEHLDEVIDAAMKEQEQEQEE